MTCHDDVVVSLPLTQENKKFTDDDSSLDKRISDAAVSDVALL